MGWNPVKSITKAVKKVFKSISKAAKSVWKGVQKVMASKYFKIGMLVISVISMGTALAAGAAAWSAASNVGAGFGAKLLEAGSAFMGSLTGGMVGTTAADAATATAAAGQTSTLAKVAEGAQAAGAIDPSALAAATGSQASGIASVIESGTAALSAPAQANANIFQRFATSVGDMIMSPFRNVQQLAGDASAVFGSGPNRFDALMQSKYGFQGIGSNMGPFAGGSIPGIPDVGASEDLMRSLTDQGGRYGAAGIGGPSRAMVDPLSPIPGPLQGPAPADGQWTPDFQPGDPIETWTQSGGPGPLPPSGGGADVMASPAEMMDPGAGSNLQVGAPGGTPLASEGVHGDLGSGFEDYMTRQGVPPRTAGSDFLRGRLEAAVGGQTLPTMGQGHEAWSQPWMMDKMGEGVGAAADFAMSPSGGYMLGKALEGYGQGQAAGELAEEREKERKRMDARSAELTRSIESGEFEEAIGGFDVPLDSRWSNPRRFPKGRAAPVWERRQQGRGRAA